jgi:hypothetical protein
MMLASRALSSPLLRRSLQAAKPSLRSLGSTSTQVLTPEEHKWFEQGVLDERGLTVFHTLHEMQVNSCKVYAKKQLFATYSEESKQFEWMTFQDYADRVDACRAVLKDLGESPCISDMR